MIVMVTHFLLSLLRLMEDYKLISQLATMMTTIVLTRSFVHTYIRSQHISCITYKANVSTNSQHHELFITELLFYLKCPVYAWEV